MPHSRRRAPAFTKLHALALLATLATAACGHTVVRGPDSCDVADKSNSAFDGGNVSGYFSDRDGVTFGAIEPASHLGLAKSGGTTQLNVGWGEHGAKDTTVPKGAIVSVALADGSQFQATVHSDAPATSDVVVEQIFTTWTAGATLTNEQLIAMTNAAAVEIRVASDAQVFVSQHVDEDVAAKVQTLANCLAHHAK